MKKVEARLGVSNISFRSRYQHGDIQRGLSGMPARADNYPAPRSNANGHRPHALTINYGTPTPVVPLTAVSTTTRQLGRPRANTLPSFISDHETWFDDARFDGSFPSRVLPFLYLGNLYVASCVMTSDVLSKFTGITLRMYICSTPSESRTSSPLVNVLSYPHPKRLPPSLHLTAHKPAPYIPLPPRSSRGKTLEIQAPSGSKNVKAGLKSLTSKASATMASTRSNPNSTPSAHGSKKRVSRGGACWYTAAWACLGARR